MRVGVDLGIICGVTVTTVVALRPIGHKLDLDSSSLGLGSLGFLLLGDQIPIGMARHSPGAEAEAMGAASTSTIPSGLNLVIASLGGLLQCQHVFLALEFHGQLEVGGRNIFRGTWRFRNLG